MRATILCPQIHEESTRILKVRNGYVLFKPLGVGSEGLSKILMKNFIWAMEIKPKFYRVCYLDYVKTHGFNVKKMVKKNGLKKVYGKDKWTLVNSACLLLEKK